MPDVALHIQADKTTVLGTLVGSSLGAAFVAGKGIGVFANWSDIEKCIDVRTVTKPNMENHQHYQALFKIYREICGNLKHTYRELVRVAAPDTSMFLVRLGQADSR